MRDEAKILEGKIEDQRKHYQTIASGYDAHWNRENSNHLYKIEAIADAIFRAAPEPGPLDIMEVGGGTGIHAGSFLRAHAARIRSFTLNDLSVEMLAQARQRLSGFDVSYVASPAESLVAEKKFDAIYLSGAMHHFAGPERSIAELKKSLRPGGVLVICEPIVWNPVNFVRAGIRPLDWGQFSVTRPAVRRWLQKAGMTVDVDRVLHWRAGGNFGRRLWPYQRLDRFSALDSLAVMFLFAAVNHR